MPLPSADIPWPPENQQPVYAKLAEWAAWYSGEPSRIIDIYAGLGTGSGGSATPWWRFWSRARAGLDGYQRALLHVPVASDLAAVSGALLFGEPPKVRIRDERVQEAPKTPATPSGAPPKADTPEAKTERRLLDLIEQGDVNARLVEAAESAAALGGVYIYPFWDTALRDFPLLAIAQADSAVPEFVQGFLSAVTFHRIVQVNGNQLWRHIERHEVEGDGESRQAVVLHGLYRGSSDRLGAGLPLGDSPETARLIPRVVLPFPELGVEYIPNIRPNRLWRASGHGVADIQGSETLLDALDETYASWMRDVRLAKARILVPREYLRPDANGTPSFDVDQEIYVPMDMEPGMSQDARAMLAHQFAIRYLEHRETAKDLVERIVSGAGYTPGSLGAIPTGTGTALRVSEHKTLLTLRKKSGWWRTAIANVLYHMLQIDVEIFKTTITPMRPTVTTADSIIDNPLELAQTALALKTAESASVETRVRLVHPDWSNMEIDAEVQRIKDDTPTPPTVGSFGNPATDPASTGNLPTTDQGKGTAPNHPPPASPPMAKNAKG